MLIRLDKLISEVANVSRQDAKKLVTTGCVTVEGIVIKKSDYKADTLKEIKLNGNDINYQPFVYIMLNKPKGVVSASVDKNDVTVVDIVKKDYPKRQLFPAGRLDKISTGFILLTDDGQLAHDILSPKKHVSKTYVVELDAPMTQEIAKSFNDGVTLSDGTELKSATAERLFDDYNVKVIVKQGVYHQIKRMFGVFDIGVNELHRTHIGGVELDKSLLPGQYRTLSELELETISKG